MGSDESSPEGFLGLVWIISVLLKWFWLLFTTEVYSICCVKHKAFCYGPFRAILSTSFSFFLPLWQGGMLIHTK